MPEYLVNDPATGQKRIETARNATEAMQNYSPYASAAFIQEDGSLAKPPNLMSDEESDWNAAFRERWG